MVNNDDNMYAFNVVGVTFENRCVPISKLSIGDLVTLRHEAGNQHDKNAIAVLDKQGESLGYVGKKENEVMRSKMNVSEITGTVAED
eukprot:jgi/Astpho2/5826/Aster-x1321